MSFYNIERPLPFLTHWAKKSRFFGQHVRPERPADLETGPDPDKPYLSGPEPFVKVPLGSYGPMYSEHNHLPSIVECPNGDLLAATQASNGLIHLVSSRNHYTFNLKRLETPPPKVEGDNIL